MHAPLRSPFTPRGVVAVMLAVVAASCSPASVASDPVASERVATPPVATESLVVESTPQDRGVLDGPVIYSTTDGDDPHKPEQLREPEQPEEHEEGLPVEEPPVQQERPPVRCEIEYLSEDLTSNRYNALPSGRLQVVAFYDGDPESSPELNIGVGTDYEVGIGGERAGGKIETFGRTIETREYQLSGCEPNGSFTVSGVVPNGVIDGLAFAIMWRDATGDFHMVKSNTVSALGASYVGMWPLGFSRDSFTERTPQITDPYGRESARGMIIGSALMANGTFELARPA